MSDKVTIEITKDELEILRNLEAGMNVSGSRLDAALTFREHMLIEKMVAQHPDPIEDGIYIYRKNGAVLTVFVENGRWATALDALDNKPILPRTVDLAEARHWTRVADLPGDEWL